MKSLTYRIIKRKNKRIQEKKIAPSFDSSSIGDIAFLLLIFFIVTSSFLLRQGIFLNLPAKDAGAVKKDVKSFFEVTPINKNFIYKNRVITRSEYKKLLNIHKEKHKESILVVYMDKQVKYERLVDALSVAEELGGGKAGIKVSLKNK